MNTADARANLTGTWRLLAAAVITWGIAAAAVGHPGSARWISFLALGGGVGALLWALRGGRATRGIVPWAGAVAVVCAALIVVSVRIDAGHEARDASEFVRATEQNGQTHAQGTLTSFPETSESQYGPRSWARAELEGSRGPVPVLLWLPEVPERHWAPGTPIAVRGSPERLDPASNAAYAISVREITERPRTNTPSFGRMAAKLRWELHDTAATIAGAELVPGFAVGDTSLVSEKLDEQMRETSLTHLTAVSGANCALITSAVMVVLTRCGVPRRLRIVCAAIGLVAFVAVVGPDASVQRAAVMAAVILLSGFGGKRSMALPALGAAILVLLIADPWQSLQPGFTLSVAATGGILLLVPIVERGMRPLRLPGFLRLPIAVSFASQVACGPLLLFLAPGIPAVGVLANVLAAPAAPVGTGIGVVALVLLPVSPSIGAGAVWVASLATRWVAATAEVTASLPFARWHWPDGWPGALLLAACEAAVLLAWAIRSGRLSPPGMRSALREPWQVERPRSGGRTLSAALLLGAAGVGVAIIVVTPVAERLGVPSSWAVVACDVGQGDALLLRDPAIPDAVMLVDTGDDAELLQACLQRFRVERISLAVLTHDDADHVGALGSVSDRIDAALISPDSDVPEDDRSVVTQLRAAKIPYVVGESGMTGAIGERETSLVGSQGLIWKVLAPPSGARPTSTNAASLVLLADTGDISTLLLGDTGESEQIGLSRALEGYSIDVVKVAHHGSRDQDPALYEAVSARYGLISVGEGNGYGHPADATLSVLQHSGTRALRTDEYGSIALSAAGVDIAIWVERRSSQHGSHDSSSGRVFSAETSVRTGSLGSWRQQHQPLGLGRERPRFRNWSGARLVRPPWCSSVAPRCSLVSV